MAESLPSTRDDAIMASATDYAVKFHQLGKLAEAEKFYAAILQVKPDHFDALRLLGVLRQQQLHPDLSGAGESAGFFDAEYEGKGARLEE